MTMKRLFDFTLSLSEEVLRMLIDVVNVRPHPDFKLDLEFENGERGRFDMTPCLDYPVFKRLQNPAFFSLARVDYGTVTWRGDTQREIGKI